MIIICIICFTICTCLKLKIFPCSRAEILFIFRREISNEVFLWVQIVGCYLWSASRCRLRKMKLFAVFFGVRASTQQQPELSVPARDDKIKQKLQWTWPGALSLIKMFLGPSAMTVSHRVWAAASHSQSQALMECFTYATAYRPFYDSAFITPSNDDLIKCEQRGHQRMLSTSNWLTETIRAHFALRQTIMFHLYHIRSHLRPSRPRCI